MTIVVRFSMRLSRLSWIYFSVTESREDVASSRMRIGEAASMARAMAILCRSPPDSFVPRSPTSEAYPLGHFVINSSQFASLAALNTSSLDASILP